MKKHRRQWGCGLLAALALVYAPLSALALDAGKDEVVYVNLLSDGQVGQVYVVNIFELYEDGVVTDYGDYVSLRNLSTTDLIRQQDGQIEVEAPRGKFYYQGELASAELPWLFTISYTLDGQPVSAEALAGQSGALRVRLSVRQNPACNPVFFKNFALQISLTLDNARCTSIVAEDATIANAGDNKLLSFIILPGKEKELTVSADVTDFEMEGIQISGVPLSLSIDRPDTSEFTDQIGDLQSGVQDLDSGAARIAEAIGELDDGVGDLQDGAASLVDGVFEMKKGASELTEGADALRGGASALAEGITVLDGQSAALVEGSAQVQGGLQLLAQGLSGVNAGELEAAAEEAAAVKQGSAEFLAALQTLASAGSETDPALAAAVAALAEQYASLNAGVGQLSDGFIQQSGGLGAAATGITALSAQYTALHGGLVGYTQGVSGLKTGYDALHTGIKGLASGVGALYEGSIELKDGVEELYRGVLDLKDATRRLYDGSSELADGTYELRDRTGGLDAEVDDKIDELLEEYQKTDFVMESFVSSRNTQVDSVQFVIKTQSVSIPEAPQEVPEEAPALTFWQRFLRLFGW